MRDYVATIEVTIDVSELPAGAYQVAVRREGETGACFRRKSDNAARVADCGLTRKAAWDATGTQPRKFPQRRRRNIDASAHRRVMIEQMPREPTDRLKADDVADLLERARDCAKRRSWSSALTAFRSADQIGPLQIDDLECWSVAAYLSGHDSEFHQVLERLHRAYLEAGNRPSAARSAFWLGFSLMLRGDLAQSNAWLARGAEHIEGRDCVEKGYLLLPVAEHQLHRGDTEAAYATAAEAGAIGDRFCDVDLTAAARHVRGRALILQGQVPSGLTLLDQTMLAVVAGELSPMMTGLMYCSIIEACRDVYAIGRAREWTSALSRWCERQSEMVAFTGTCLVHRAAIMQFHGAWPDSLSEACPGVRACRTRGAQAARRRRVPAGRNLSSARRACEGRRCVSARESTGIRAATGACLAAACRGSARRRRGRHEAAPDRDDRAITARSAPASPH
jgi:hypothetical protein